MKNYTSAFFSGICFVAGLSTSSLAQVAPSFQEIVDSALVNDYAYDNKVLALKLTELDQERLRDVYMPKLELNAKGAYAYGEMDFTTPAFAIPQLQMGFPEHQNRYQLDNFLTTADLKASYVLFAGGQVGYLKKANKAKLEAETAMLQVDRDEVVKNVAAVYDQLGMLKVVEQTLNDSKKRLDESERFASKALANGLITQFDYNKINLAVSQLDAEFKELEGKRQLVLLNLHTITNIEMDRLEKIDEDLKVMTVTNYDAVGYRPELVALQAAIRANEYKIKAAKTWWIPKIGASASLGYFGLHNGHLQTKEPFLLTYPNNLNHEFQNINAAPIFMGGIGLKWDLFDGGEGINATRRAKVELKMAENKRDDVQEKINLQLEKTKLELSIATDQIRIKEVSLQIAESSMVQAKKEFELGLIKSLDLLQAENDLQVAKMEYAQALFQQRRAAMNYLNAAGKLDVQSVK